MKTLKMGILDLTMIIIISALSKQCYGKILLNKCCDENLYVNFEMEKCLTLNGEKKLNLTQVSVHSENLMEIGRLGEFFELKPGFFDDPDLNKDELTLHSLFHSSFRLIKNGTVLMEIRGMNMSNTRDARDFCIDIVEDEFKNKNIEVYYLENARESPQLPHYKYGFLISSIFLFLLLVVYCLLPELRTLGGMILMAYAASLIIAYLGLFSFQVIQSKLTEMGCRGLTYMIYYFMLCNSCWMNVMSYDIWWTFRGYAKARPINRRGIHHKFAMYCLYSFGLPMAMTVALATLNEIDEERLPGIIKPQIPLRGCFLEEKTKTAYLYVPMLILIIFNHILFGLSVFNIWRLNRGNHILTKNNTPLSRRSQIHRFFVYLKLSILMGLAWIFEVVSSYYPDFQFWYISDTYNNFIGLIIFLLFVCKKKVFIGLRNRITGNKVSKGARTGDSSLTRSRSRSTDTLELNPHQIAP